MNKLVLKDPVLRFKSGKKISKFIIGGLSPTIYNTYGLYAQHASFYNNDIGYINPLTITKGFGGGVRGKNIPTKNKRFIPLMANEKWYDNSGTLITPEKVVPQKNGTVVAKINGKWYNLNGLLVTKFTSNKSNTKVKRTIPSDNYYLKGFGGNGLKEEITKAGGVRTMLKKLIEMGLLKDKYGADGRWGLNTQEAYNKYKQILAPGLPTAEEAGPVEKIPVELRTPIMKNIPLGYGASLAQAAKQYTKLAKQGGQLVSKNSILRFKRNFRKVDQ